MPQDLLSSLLRTPQAAKMTLFLLKLINQRGTTLNLVILLLLFPRVVLPLSRSMGCLDLKLIPHLLQLRSPSLQQNGISQLVNTPKENQDSQVILVSSSQLEDQANLSLKPLRLSISVLSNIFQAILGIGVVPFPDSESF
jgi:hypothetical protein